MTWTARTESWVRAHPVGPDLLLSLLLAATVGAFALEILLVSRAQEWTLWVAGGCGVVVLASVALRRVATDLAFGLASLAMLITTALPNVTLPSGVLGLPDTGRPMEIPLFYLPTSAVYLVLLYSVAAHRPRRTSQVALAISAAGALLCTAKTATAYGALPAGWLTLLLAVLALLAAAAGTWTVGVLTFEQRRRRAEESAAAADRAVLDERRRIARDMHDIVAHSLAVIVRQADGGSAIAEKSPARAASALSAIADTAREALSDMRGTLAVLNDSASGDGAQPTLAEIPALVERVRSTGLEVHLTEDGSGDGMSPGAMMAAYRLVQEGLTNTVKHAGPHPTVTVSLSHSPRASTVEVTDDGGGDGSSHAHPSSLAGAGVGLNGVRDRVQAAGGAFAAGPSDRGFRLRAEFPVKEQR